MPPSPPFLLGPWALGLTVLVAVSLGFFLGWRRGRARCTRELEVVRDRSREESLQAQVGLRAELSQQESRIRKLQEIRRRNDDIFRHLRQGVLVLDRNFVVEWSNSAARRLTHRTSIQLLGAPIESIDWRIGGKAAGFDASNAGPWRRCLQGAAPVDPVRLSLAVGGKDLWLELYCFPANNPEGEVDQVVVLLEEVTRQVIAERQETPPPPAPRQALPEPPSSAPPVETPRRDPRVLAKSPPANGEPLRVLLVEDNPVNQAVAMGILRKLGLELEMAADGQQALDRLAKSTFRMVFMDCQMPVMDGYEATRRIRDPATPVLDHAVPIVAVTANALKGDREKCLECGMDDYLPKPVTRDGFEQILARWIPGWTPAVISAFPMELEESPSQAPPLDQREIFDRPALVRRLLGQEELIGTLLSMFHQDAPEQLAELEAAVAQGDLAKAQRIAHGLKGTMANLEARTGAQAAAVVDHACRRGDTRALVDALADLKVEIGRAQEAMRASG